MLANDTEMNGEIEDKVVVFNCGHAVPRTLSQGTLCSLCQDQENLKG